MSEDADRGRAGRLARLPDGAIAATIFVTLMALYNANGDALPGTDALPSLHVGLSLLDDGDFALTPEDEPYLFHWILMERRGPVNVQITDWEEVRVPPHTWREVFELGALRMTIPIYLAASVDPASLGYVSLYGPGTAVVAAPALAVASLMRDDLATDRSALLRVGKRVASACVALAASVLFLAGIPFVDRFASLVVALVFGTATLAWSSLSQTLWSSAPTVLFTSLAILCHLRLRDGPLGVAACGFFAACAVTCRASSVFLALALGAYWLWQVRPRREAAGATRSRGAAVRALLAYGGGALPIALLQAAYQHHYLGSAFKLAQQARASALALEQTGVATPWQTPMWEGLLGLLVSPSRGLLVYSPIALFALWGALRVWRRPDLEALRPVSAAVVMMILSSSRWLWWPGGWSFGYRILSDTLPLLCICSLAIVPSVLASRPLLAGFAVTLAWSLMVQGVGVYAYNVVGWNNRRAFEVVKDGEVTALVLDTEPRPDQVPEGSSVRPVFLDTGNPQNRHRFWSIRDSQLLYYLTHLREAHALKPKVK